MERTITLGDEYDDLLRDRLIFALRTLGAKFIDSSRVVGGSQDLENYKYELNGTTVEIVAET
jgi:hypothetical protein